MPDLSHLRIPIYEDVNDEPIEPTPTSGCNGAYFLQRYHALLTYIELYKVVTPIPKHLTIPELKTYNVFTSAGTYYLKNLTIKCLAGTARVSLLLNGDYISGLSNINISSFVQTLLPNGLYLIPENQQVSLLVSAVNNCKDLEMTLNVEAR